MPFTDFLGNETLDHIFGNGTYTPPTIYVALYVGDPDGAGTEVSGNAYARVAHSDWSAASGKTLQNNTEIQFATPTGSWGTVTHFALFDALTAGNRLTGDALTTSQAIGTGNDVSFPAGNLDVYLDQT